jgi:hypothetical protein
MYPTCPEAAPSSGLFRTVSIQALGPQLAIILCCVVISFCISFKALEAVIMRQQEQAIALSSDVRPDETMSHVAIQAVMSIYSRMIQHKSLAS